ncbi:MAG: replication initiator [Acidimicrobiales bacterium]
MRPRLDRVADVAERVARGELDGLIGQLEANGGCARPVRLRGSVLAVDAGTGESFPTYSTTGEPDGVLLKACGCRRQTRCPACSVIYKGDARAIVTAGLTGGKGADASVAERPAVFVTLTAPSFGAVHTVWDGTGACQAGRGSCAHGLARGCGGFHELGDPELGEALCPDCYDYEGAVIWNARVNELWRRTLVYAQLSLAARLGVPAREVRRHARLSFAKVVEFQRRGLVHVHAVVRLDPGDDGESGLDAANLGAAVLVGARRAKAPNPLHPERPVVWGAQVDIRPVLASLRLTVARYLAKYATKSVDDSGALDTRLTPRRLGELDLRPQLEMMVGAAWRLGARPELEALHLRHWAHTLGYRGHWVTKSPGYSTTFAALRQERQEWRRSRVPRPTPGHEGAVEVASWEYAGTGYSSPGDAWLAESVSAGRELARRTRWEERNDG